MLYKKQISILIKLNPLYALENLLQLETTSKPIVTSLTIAEAMLKLIKQ